MIKDNKVIQTQYCYLCGKKTEHSCYESNEFPDPVYYAKCTKCNTLYTSDNPEYTPPKEPELQKQTKEFKEIIKEAVQMRIDSFEARTGLTVKGITCEKQILRFADGKERPTGGYEFNFNIIILEE